MSLGKLVKFIKSSAVTRHGVVSCACALTEFFVFLIFYYSEEASLSVSHSVSFILASTLGFIGHSYFTFRVGRLLVVNGLFFCVQAFIALCLGYYALSTLISMELNPPIAKVLQLFTVFFFNISFGRFISFKKRYADANRL